LESYNFLDKDLVNIVGNILVQASVCILLDYYFRIEVEYLFVDYNYVCIVKIVGGMDVKMVETYFVDSVVIETVMEMMKN
jgi:hypothetical protein